MSPLIPMEGESIGQLLRRASVRMKLGQVMVATLVTARSNGTWVVRQGFISDLMRDKYPPRWLHGRKTAGEDPRYTAIAEVLGLEPAHFVALVEQRQLQGRSRRQHQANSPVLTVAVPKAVLPPDDTPPEVRSLLRRWTITGRITRVLTSRWNFSCSLADER